MAVSCAKTALFCCHILGFMLFVHGLAQPHYEFTVKEAAYTRLCKTKNILTVNGKFPGPTLYARKGDTIFVDVYNKGEYNITIHWHGLKQPRNPWSDGPQYITQCPIKPGGFFRYKLIFSSEEGTLWWHAHSDWWRATVHGALVVYPKIGTNYPFPKPDAEIPIILGEWWNKDINQVLRLMLQTGGAPNVSDAFTINGQPGDLYPCSSADTFKLTVDRGKTYLLRIVNAALNEILFYAIANHPVTVVGIDGSYTKPLTRNYITVSPGQTADVLLHTNQKLGHYYMAARVYSTLAIEFDNTTTTAIIQYNGNKAKSSKPRLPHLPYYNNTGAFLASVRGLRSLASEPYPHPLPVNITNRIFTTISINAFPCRVNGTCEGPNGTRLAASMSNITFREPSPIDILQAYYRRVRNVYGTGFPNFPPLAFNYTAEILPLEYQISRPGTEVKELEYNSTVEIVFQGTNLVTGIDHPMHLHGYSFYVVGIGLGNFNETTDPLNYNLVDPPVRNTAAVPRNGWMTIRFKADNPGVWFMHCHLERHLTWGMDTVFIVRDGKTPESKMLPPPPKMPPC